MSNQNINRQPSGQPTGGQFAETHRPTSGISLAQEDHDDDLPEVMVNVTWQQWNDDDYTVEVGSDTFDLAPFIAETSPERRLTEFGSPEDPGALDYWVAQAQERGLVREHDGPFHAHSLDLEELVQRQELEDIPTRSEPKIIAGVPLTEPLTVEEVLAEADEDGYVTATLTADLEDLLDARAEVDPGGLGEHDLLADMVSPLPAYGSHYKVRGTTDDGRLLIDFSTDVRAAAEDED